jgi:uncharacterized protein
VQGALQQSLGELIVIEQVNVDSQDATLTVTITYMVRRTQQRQSATFATGGSS